MKDLFSPTELRVIKLIGKRKIALTDVAVKCYARDKSPPLNPNNTVAGIVRRINQKCKYFKLDWFINGSGLGRGGKTVWRDKR